MRLPSVTGTENEAQDFLARWLRGYGLDVDLWTIDESIRKHRAFCDDGLPVTRKNLVARFGEGKRTDRAALVLNGHIDVVPEGERELWKRNPYAGDVAGGELHGRGACDMKGGLAAAVIALRAVMKLGITPKRSVLLESVVGEETGGLGTLAAIQRGYRGDAAVIAEPTSLALCPVQAGALSFRLHVRGKAAHGAMRESGISAIEKFQPILESLRALELERHRGVEHPLYPKDTLIAPLSVGTLRAGNWPSTVPEELVAEGRYGIFPGEEPEAARDVFERAVDVTSRRDPWLAEHPTTVEWFEGQFESGETEAGAPILEALSRCHVDALEAKPRTHGVSYGSDLRLFTRYAQIPAVLYGPGDVRLAHADNERLPLDELERAVVVLALLVARCIGA